MNRSELDMLKTKVATGDTLTSEEEFIYLTEVMGHSEEEANTIISIAENAEETFLID